MTEPRSIVPPLAEDGTELRRYERPHEPETVEAAGEGEVPLSPEALSAALDASSLTPGAKTLLAGMLRLGRPAVFGGGGAGIEYGALLKTAARPDILVEHAREVADHLRERGVNLLVVPGMSGYPVGAIYATVAGIPALLLKKQRHATTLASMRYPAGSFVIPSYTGEGDVVMSADLVALRDIVTSVLTPQLAAQQDAAEVTLTIRVAGADDIIDKATMSQAVSESALVVARKALEDFVARHRARTGDQRPIAGNVQVVAWVTPLIKGYNRPQEHLQRCVGITAFAGLNVTSVQVTPPAIGIEGVGLIAFDPVD